jgi:galactokinase
MTDQNRVVTVTQGFLSQYHKRPQVWVRAPGRIDLMGSHTGYNDGLSLMLALNHELWIAARSRTDKLVRIYSHEMQRGATFALRKISHDYETPWTDFARGVAAAFRKAGYPTAGFDGIINSTLPIGSGMGSSAALVAAVAYLFQILTGATIQPLELARLCRDVETNFIGGNSDLRDYLTVLTSREGTALLVDSRTSTSRAVKMHPDIQIVICDTRLQHEYAQAMQQERQEECRQGLRILSGFYPDVTSLRDVIPEMLLTHRADLDPLVLRRCRFIVDENARVIALARALAAGDRVAISNLTAESYAGAMDLYGIVTEEMQKMMDAIVGAPGAIGARQSGLGLGGSLVAFVEVDMAEQFATHVKQRYWASMHVKAATYSVLGAGAAGKLAIT